MEKLWRSDEARLRAFFKLVDGFLRLHAAQNAAFRSGCLPSIKEETALETKKAGFTDSGNL
jgi:hypothetical protein